MPTLKIACSGAALMSYKSLTEFQGELKSLAKEDYERLRRQLEAGYSFPVAVWQAPDKLNYILDGHQRLRTITKMAADGWDIPDLPVSLVEAATYKEAKTKLLAAASQYGKVESQGLYEFMTDSGIDIDEIIRENRFPEIDLDDFRDEYIDDTPAVEGKTDEDAVPETAPPVTKLGDIWTLGSHRIMCGDSTDAASVAILINGKKADMVFTDPPYGVSFKSNMSDRFDVIKNDDKILKISDIIYDVMSENSAAFIWTSHHVYHLWRDQFSSFYKQTIIWHKGGGGMGDLQGQYALNYEIALFCVKGSPKFRRQRGMAVWKISKDAAAAYAHPTQKPVELAENAIEDFSDLNDNIIDLFGGSGSTLIACEKTSRKCFMMELDEKYCDVIIKRWQDFTGKQAAREDGKTFDELAAAI